MTFHCSQYRSPSLSLFKHNFFYCFSVGCNCFDNIKSSAIWTGKGKKLFPLWRLFIRFIFWIKFCSNGNGGERLSRLRVILICINPSFRSWHSTAVHHPSLWLDSTHSSWRLGSFDWWKSNIYSWQTSREQADAPPPSPLKSQFRCMTKFPESFITTESSLLNQVHLKKRS